MQPLSLLSFGRPAFFFSFYVCVCVKGKGGGFVSYKPEGLNLDASFLPVTTPRLIIRFNSRGCDRLDGQSSGDPLGLENTQPSLSQSLFLGGPAFFLSFLCVYV